MWTEEIGQSQEVDDSRELIKVQRATDRRLCRETLRAPFTVLREKQFQFESEKFSLHQTKAIAQSSRQVVAE